MPDVLKETTTTGWGSRIMSSIKGILVGVILFVLSFGVLYWNEGRVDVSKIAKTAVDVSSETPAPEADQKLVAVAGTLSSSEKLGDTYLQAGDYLTLSRNVEIYAWVEESKSSSTTNTGGSETTETTTTYTQEWVSTPADSTKFKDAVNHVNPAKSIEDAQMTVASANIGSLSLSPQSLDLPAGSPLMLTTSNVLLKEGIRLVDQNTLYKGKGSPEAPQLGDLKIRYTALQNPLANVTVFGKLNAGQKALNPFITEDSETTLYRAFIGTRDQAIAALHGEYSTMLWVFRLIGFLMMWFGMSSILGPISVFLDVLPFLGSLGRTGIGAVTFGVALVLSAVTIVVSMILHSWIALLAVALLLIGGAVALKKRK